MQLLIRMQVLQPQQQLPQNNSNIILPNQPRLHQIRTTAPRTKFHDNPQLRTLRIRAIVFRHIRGLQLGQNGDFLNDIFDLIFGVFNVDDLDGYGVARPFVDSAQIRVCYWKHVYFGGHGDGRTLCTLFQSSHHLIRSAGRQTYCQTNKQTNTVLLGIQKLRIQRLVGLLPITIFLRHIGSIRPSCTGFLYRMLSNCPFQRIEQLSILVYARPLVADETNPSCQNVDAGMSPI